MAILADNKVYAIEQYAFIGVTVEVTSAVFLKVLLA